MCSTKAAAVAASNALPPRSSTACAHAVAVQCVVADIPKVPSRVGRVVKAGGGVNVIDSAAPADQLTGPVYFSPGPLPGASGMGEASRKAS